MNRILLPLLALLLVVSAPTGNASAANEAAPHAVAVAPAQHASSPTTPTTDAPPTTEAPIDRPDFSDNQFFPEDRDITSCIGALERPGCGSESRGGWRQTLILVAIGGGLLIVFGNVIRGVRKRNP